MRSTRCTDDSAHCVQHPVAGQRLRHLLDTRLGSQPVLGRLSAGLYLRAIPLVHACAMRAGSARSTSDPESVTRK